MTTAFEQAPDAVTYPANTAVLRFVLRILGWSQAEFGRRLGLHESSASRILRPGGTITAGVARRILDLVPGLSAEEVVSLPGISPDLPEGAKDFAPIATFTVECLDDGAAQRFANHLRGQGVDVSDTTGANVIVPWAGGSASFVIDVYGGAVEGGFANDRTAARAMAETLRSLPGAK